MRTTVSPRARSHEDRGGDPLDGLVNLFDLGIVLAVAFLIAALSSVDLTEVLTDREAVREKVSPRSIVIDPDEQAQAIELEPGQKVVGSGEQIGRRRPSGDRARTGRGRPQPVTLTRVFRVP